MREKIVPIEVTPEMMKMLEICKKNKSINPELYTKYDVKRGLRDINATKGLALKKLHIYFFSANFQIKMSLIFSQRHFHICELFPLHLCVILSCKHRVRI